MDNYSPKDLIEIFLFVLFKRKWLAIGSFLIFLFLVLFATLMIDPEYKATAKILVRSNPQQQIVLFRDIETPGESNRRINQAQNLIEISTSRKIAETIVREFNLHLPDKPDHFRDYIKQGIKSVIKYPKHLAVQLGLLEEKPDNLLSEAIEELLEDVQDIRLKQDTEVIDLSIWGKSPKLAMDIANRTAELIVRKTSEIVREEASEAFEFTLEQVSLAEASLQRADYDLAQVRERESIVSPTEEQSLLLKRLGDLRSKYQMDAAELKKLRKRQEEAKKQLDNEAKDITSSTTLAANSIIEALKILKNELSARLAGLLTDHNQSHPEVKAITYQLAELNEQIASEDVMVKEKVVSTINPIHQELRNQLIDLQITINALENNLYVLQRDIDKMQKDVVAIAKTGMEMDRVERNRDVHAKRVQTLQSKLLELEVKKLSRMGEYDIRVIDAAYVPDDADPDWPDWELSITLGIFLSLIIGIAAPFFREFWNDSIEMPLQIERDMELAVLGIVPILGVRDAITSEIEESGMEKSHV